MSTDEVWHDTQRMLNALDAARRPNVEPQRRPRYTLKELRAQCDPKAPVSKDEREWLDSEAFGRELI